MKLPVLDSYAFPVTIPSSNTTISIRPFLVKEEKLLLIAQESQNEDEQVAAIGQVIMNCSNGAIVPSETPYFDIEYIMIHLRARSVGETITPVYVCHNKINETDECGHRTEVTINLQEVKVSEHIATSPAESIELSDRYMLHLRYPTVYTVQRLLLLNTKNSKNDILSTQKAMDCLVDIFDTLEDRETKQIYNFSEVPLTEKINFLNNLRTVDFEKMVEFIQKMPTVSLSTSYTCEACQFAHQIELRGLADFLG